jgi:hypothetical protein
MSGRGWIGRFRGRVVSDWPESRTRSTESYTLAVAQRNLNVFMQSSCLAFSKMPVKLNHWVR